MSNTGTNGTHQKRPPIQKPGTPKVKPGRRNALHQVVAMQTLTFRAAEKLAADIDSSSDRKERGSLASSIANLGKAWVSLQDAKREIRGKPRAGSLRPESPKAPKKQTRPTTSYDSPDAPAEDKESLSTPTP